MRTCEKLLILIVPFFLLSGCITSVSPDPEETVFMQIGDTRFFSVEGPDQFNVDGMHPGYGLRYEWHFQYIGYNEPVGSYSKEFQFEATHDYIGNNILVCRCMIRSWYVMEFSGVPIPPIILYGWHQAEGGHVSWEVAIE